MAEGVSHGRIAKNTVALYLRMLLTVVVSLYTSRIVLNALGVTDYGIYAVVGSVLAMFGFLNGSMAGATSRFLTVEIGKGDSKRLRLTFSNALIIHMAIGAVILVIGETFGLWFLNTKLVIPADRMVQANIVYQFSVIGSIFGITQVPYNASLIANEHITVFAYFEIFNAVIKLAVAYAIMVAPSGRLVLYAGLMLGASLISMIFYRFYCLRKFPECRFRWCVDKSVMKPMLSFSGWDFFGNMSVTVNFQGYVIAINMLFGTIMNAAYSIASTVQGTLKGLATNVLTAFRPPIIKEYARGNVGEMSRLVFMASQFVSSLYLVMAMPLYFGAETVLRLWLGEVPPYSAFMLKILLISCLFNVLNNTLNIPIHAVGKMGVFSFSTGMVYLVSPFAFYFIAKAGIDLEKAFAVFILTYFAGLTVTISCLKWLIPHFSLRRLVFACYLPIVAPMGAYLLFAYFFHFEDNFLKLLILSAVSVAIWGSYCWFFVLNAAGRRRVLARFRH